MRSSPSSIDSPVRSRWRPAVVLATLLAGLLVPSAADAGTYTVHTCRTPAGGAASTSPWAFAVHDAGSELRDDTCPRGGLRVALKPNATHPSDAAARLYLYAPADTTIVSYRLWRSARVRAGTGYYFSALERHGDAWQWAGDVCKGLEGCRGVGDPTSPLSDVNRWDRRPVAPATGIALFVFCGYADASATRCEYTTEYATEAWLHRADIEFADDFAPTFDTAPTGALLGTSGVVSGVAHVSLQASDRGGGLSSAQVEVDGRVVAEQALSGSTACRPPYTSPVPCPRQASATVALDTAALADGAHGVRVLLRDVAGNVTASEPTALTTRNAPPDVSCVGEPVVSGPARLSAGLVPAGARGRAARPRRRLRIRHASRLRPSFGGRLVGADGKPLANAPVCVVTRPAGATGAPAPLARLTTDAQGRFATTLARGSSREVWAIHRVTAGAVTAKAILGVIPRLVVRPSRTSLRNGDKLVFRGRVASGPIPRQGLLVRAEAWRGTHWQPFGEVRAKGARGRFRIPYRFTGTSGSQVYSLRVKVVPQAAYPYLGVTSRPIRVRVTG